jgi:hypothetical protein
MASVFSSTRVPPDEEVTRQAVPAMRAAAKPAAVMRAEKVVFFDPVGGMGGLLRCISCFVFPLNIRTPAICQSPSRKNPWDTIPFQRKRVMSPVLPGDLSTPIDKGSSPGLREVRHEAAMDIALTTPVAEGDPPKAGEPPGLVPGGPGGKGLYPSQSRVEDLPE